MITLSEEIIFLKHSCFLILKQSLMLQAQTVFGYHDFGALVAMHCQVHQAG